MMGNELLFDLAVKLIRRGVSFVDALKEIEAQGPPGIDAMAIYAAAREWTENFQKESFEAAIGAAQQGMSHAEIAKRLRSLGFQSWDADVLASRAMAKAAETQVEP